MREANGYKMEAESKERARKRAWREYYRVDKEMKKMETDLGINVHPFNVADEDADDEQTPPKKKTLKRAIEDVQALLDK